MSIKVLLYRRQREWWWWMSLTNRCCGFHCVCVLSMEPCKPETNQNVSVSSSPRIQASVTRHFYQQMCTGGTPIEARYACRVLLSQLSMESSWTFDGTLSQVLGWCIDDLTEGNARNRQEVTLVLIAGSVGKMVHVLVVISWSGHQESISTWLTWLVLQWMFRGPGTKWR